MTEADAVLVNAVRDRINAYTLETGPPPELPVSLEEFDACERAVREYLESRGVDPIPFTRTGRGILFKNVELYPT